MGESESKSFETLETDVKYLLYTVLCFKVPRFSPLVPIIVVIR